MMRLEEQEDHRNHRSSRRGGGWRSGRRRLWLRWSSKDRESPRGCEGVKEVMMHPYKDSGKDSNVGNASVIDGVVNGLVFELLKMTTI